MMWGCLLRMGQALVESSPTLLCGFLVAALLRRAVPPETTRELFGGKSWTSLPRAWLIGTLLPVCSFGVIPVARELRRAGVASGTVLTFAITAPLLNPISILYGLTLSEPFVILCFVLASLLVAVIAGAVWNRLLSRPEDAVQPQVEALPRPGLRRMGVIVAAAGQETVGPALGYCLIGLAGVGIVSALIPHGALQYTMSHGDWWAPPIMAGVSLPAYAPPMKVMMMLGLMFDHGNSIGAAYVLLVLGAGMNVGLLAWMCVSFGVRRTLTWLAVVIVVAVGIGYAVEYPLHFAGRTADHTHAFDDFCSPFIYGFGSAAQFQVWPLLVDKVGAGEALSLGCLLLLMLIGLITPWCARCFPGQPDLQVGPAPDLAETAIWNRPLSARTLTILSLIGLALSAGVAAFVYYPDPDTVFKEMLAVNAEANDAVRSGRIVAAQREIRIWDDLTRKLQVGVFMRTGQLSKLQQRTAEDLREELEVVFDALGHGDMEHAREHLPAVQAAYRRCREAYAAAAR